MAEKTHDIETTATPEKPLPVLPRRMSRPKEDEKPPESPTTSGRVRPTSMQSYQRPKKKVIWKGKACIIALPLTDREAAGLPPLLKPEEVEERVEAFINAGYSVDGFELTDGHSERLVASNGQSRPVY